MKQLETKKEAKAYTRIDRFDGGMQDDFRNGALGGSAVIKGFDIHSFPHKAVPIRGVTADTTGQTAVGNLLVGTDGVFYGLGTTGGNGTIYKKATYSGVWTELGAGTSRSGATVEYSFFQEYKDYLYYWKSGVLVKCDRAGVASVDNTTLAISWTNVRTNGVVHPKDDILYIPYDNKIASLNVTSLTVAALTLPSNLIITSITPYGNYLAIAASPLNGAPIGSIVYLWDRDTSLTTLSESINWGTGILKVLNTLDGYLVGISDVGGASSSILDKDSVQIKVYSGGTPQLIKEISTIRQVASSVPDAVINTRVNFIWGGKMYFSLSITGGSTSPSLNGLWAIGKNQQGIYAVWVERLATDANTETGVLAAAIIGDYTSMVHTAVGTLTISNSNTTFATIYTATSVIESLIFNDGDSDLTKKLIGVSIMFEPLPSGATVVLDYRLDENIKVNDTNYIQIFTHTSTGSVSHGSINIESSGATLPQFKEIQFRIKSTGGAIITGLKFKSEFIDKQLY